MNKYSKYSKIKYYIKELPSRILSFKRPKWKFIQTKIKRLNNKKTKTQYSRGINHFEIRKPRFYWEKYKKTYKNGLEIKKAWQVYLGDSFTNKDLKKNILLGCKTNFILKFLSLTMRIDIFLWKLKITKSILHSRSVINNGLIKIDNEVNFNEKFFVKEGNIIQIHDSIKNFKFKQFKDWSLPVEIDCYSKCIVITKSFYNSFVEHLKFQKFEHINFRKLYCYLKNL
jgi:ribosomal 50S subunit-recycling heat shock protein